MDWFKDAAALAKEDSVYQEALSEALALEPAFLSLLDSLTPPQKNLINRYLTACENMDMAFARIAYTLGASQRM